MRNDDIRKDYKRPPSFNHLAPALESIEKQQSVVQSQYASALKHSVSMGKDLNLNHLTVMRSMNRLSNISTNTMESRNNKLGSISNSQSEIGKGDKLNLNQPPNYAKPLKRGHSSLLSSGAKSTLNVDTSKEAYQT